MNNLQVKHFKIILPEFHVDSMNIDEVMRI